MVFLKNKQTIHRIWKTFFFSVGLVLGLLILQKAVLPSPVPSDSWPGYLKLEKNSIDVLFVGNSHAECTFAPMEIYQETGVASWVMKSGGINTRQKLAYLEEALKTQHPKLIMFEVYGFHIPTRNTDIQNASAFLWMPDGLSKASAIFATSEATATPSLLFPLIRYHSRVLEKPSVPAVENMQYTGGALALTDYNSSDINALLKQAKESPAPLLTAQQMDENMSYLVQASEIAHKYHCRLVFTISPLLDQSLIAECNQIKQRIIDSPELSDNAVLDMNDHYQSIGLVQTDFRDTGHLYLTGLKKTSRWTARVVLPQYGVKKATVLSAVQKQWWNEQSSLWAEKYNN